MSRLKQIESLIIDIPDFPKQGIIFKDITHLLLNRFNDVTEELIAQINWKNVDAIAGIESRGFIFGAAMAQKLNLGFVPIRKAGKLPPPVHRESYSLEYGQDSLEIKANYQNTKRVVIIDDVIATGGTLQASVNLCGKAGLEIHACLSVINLKFLNNFNNLKAPIYSLFEY